MLKPSCDKLWHGVTVMRAWPHLYTEADLVFFLGNCLHALGMVTLSLSWLSRESELKEWIRFDVTLNNWMNCKNVLADFIAIYPACIISNLDDQFQCQKRIRNFTLHFTLTYTRLKVETHLTLKFQCIINGVYCFILVTMSHLLLLLVVDMLDMFTGRELDSDWEPDTCHTWRITHCTRHPLHSLLTNGHRATCHINLRNCMASCILSLSSALNLYHSGSGVS